MQKTYPMYLRIFPSLSVTYSFVTGSITSLPTTQDKRANKINVEKPVMAIKIFIISIP